MKTAFTILSLSPLFVLAHEGHGIESASHYHATDVWGFVIFAFGAAILWWFGGRGK